MAQLLRIAIGIIGHLFVELLLDEGIITIPKISFHWKKWNPLNGFNHSNQILPWGWLMEI